MDPIIKGALLAFFIAVSAFFSGSETAFLSISRVKLQALLDRKVQGAESISRLRQHRRKVIIYLLIGNNIANIAASALATSLALSLFGDQGLGIAIGVTTFLILTFGEIAPKSLATAYSVEIMLLFAPLHELLYFISTPLVLFFELINRVIPGVYSRATGIEKFTEEEVRSAVKLGAQHKSITDWEHRLIENVLAFNDKMVAQAMVPKGKVLCFKWDTLVTEAHQKAASALHSRFPVVKDHRVIGVVDMHSLSAAIYQSPTLRVGQVAHPPVKVKSSEWLSDAFVKLQKMGIDFALVMSDKGEFAGIVTLEDMLEEIVGEIK